MFSDIESKSSMLPPNKCRKRKQGRVDSRQIPSAVWLLCTGTLIARELQSHC